MTGATMTHDWAAVATRAFESAESQPEIALELASCPHCDCRQFHSILEYIDPRAEHGETYSLVRCALCSLVLTNPRPTPESMRCFYPDETASDVTERSNRWRWLERFALRSHFGYPPQPAGMFSKLISQLAMLRFHSRFQRREWIPFRAPGRLLDVGAKSSLFLARMRSFGWQATSLGDVCQRSGEFDYQSRSTVLAERLRASGFADQSFDAITMRHLLQECRNPRQIVIDAARLLRPGGLLVIEVPNIDSHTFAEFREHWFGLQMPRHLQHFSPKSLCATMPHDLLRVVEIGQIGMRSWIKQSARNAVEAGRNEYQSWFHRGRSFWKEKAIQSEYANHADGLRIIAERRS